MLIPEKQLQKKINSENQLYIIKINVFKLQNYFFKLFTPEPETNNSANLECRSEMCCSRLAANTGRKKVAKNRHQFTIAQLPRAISSQLWHVSAIGKKLVKQQYLLHMSL